MGGYIRHWTTASSHEVRPRAGRWLRALREGRGLSQRALARRVGVEIYTIVAQLESGAGHIPPELYSLWARALGVEAREFACTLASLQDEDAMVDVLPVAGVNDVRETAHPWRSTSASKLD
jgi:transcriptional regulator with XRE-family HTH domain